MVDIFIPKTATTPAATQVGVPQFIDNYILEVLEVQDQEITRTAFNKIITILKPNTDSSLSDVSIENYKTLLDEHMFLSNEVDSEREANPEAKGLTSSEFLNQLKWMTIKAYKNSEEVGENILAYDPIPTAYYCGDLQELTDGKSYSL